MRGFLWALLGLTLAAAPGVQAAPSAPPPLEAYGHLPSIDNISLSPSGQYLVSVGDVSGKRYILARTLTGDVVVSLQVGPTKVRDIIWVDDSHVLVTISKTGWSIDGQEREEYPLTFNIDLIARKSTLLFDQDKRFLPMFGYLVTSYVIDGRPYAFAANIPREGVPTGSMLSSRSNELYKRYYPDLWRIDLTTNDATRIAMGSQDIDTWVVGPDGKVAAYSNFRDLTSEWKLFHGMSQVLARRSARQETRLLGLGRSLGSAVVFDQSGTEDQLLEVAADGDIQTLLRGQIVTGVLRSPTTGLLTGVVIGDHEFKFFDSERQARIDAATKPFKGRIEIDSATDHVDRVVLHTTGPGDSGTYYLVDMKAGRADIIDNDYPDVPADQVGAVRRFEYRAADGLALDGILTLPPGQPAKALPVVVLPHGGPFNEYDQAKFDWLAQAFASRGYAVFQPNYRGSGGHGAALVNAGFGEFGRGMLSDAADGLKALAAAGVVDAKRACIVGFSYGGYAALAGVTVQQGLYRCAVAGSAISDPTLMVKWLEVNEGVGSSGVKFMKQALGVGQAGAPKLSDISPLNLAGRADAPILLIHGADDSVVPIDQSKDMAAALQAAHKPFETLYTQGEDHWLSNSATRTQTLKAAVAFVQKYNPAD